MTWTFHVNITTNNITNGSNHHDRHGTRFFIATIIPITITINWKRLRTAETISYWFSLLTIGRTGRKDIKVVIPSEISVKANSQPAMDIYKQFHRCIISKRLNLLTRSYQITTGRNRFKLLVDSRLVSSVLMNALFLTNHHESHVGGFPDQIPYFVRHV